MSAASFAPDAGLCASCRHSRRIDSARGSVFRLCALHATDPRFRKYPPLPVQRCAGYTKDVPPLVQRTLDLGRIRLHVAEQGEGPLVVLLHGFPEGRMSWRHQLAALANAGYHAVAPDLRGFGESDKPHAIEAYDQVELAADVVALIDALGERDAVVVGHDWGAVVAWHSALLHPDRVRAVVGMSVPFAGRPPGSPLARMRAVFQGVFFYMLYFQAEGVAERELEADPRLCLRKMYFSLSGDAPEGAIKLAPADSAFLPTLSDTERLSFLDAHELDACVRAFEKSGFRGPLNLYRNFDRTWERTAAFAGAKILQPALFLAGTRDPVVLFSAKQVERMPQAVPNLRGSLILPGAGHWIQQERPAETNAALLEFLSSL